ncbi:MAG: competence protein CoiA family protein [Gammaproteobacteria bacterium]|nr:competence protein CoiA family protein [Gammaproteobacteria bacterium]
MICFTTEQGATIEPEFSGQRTICPGCGGELVACCGQIVMWHWRHLSGVDCDPWAESPSAWHIRWQHYLKTLGASLEVFMSKDGENHRADAVLPGGTVIELQCSGISVDEIETRERFYRNMIWVFDARDPYKKDRFNLRPRGDYYSFRWKHPRKSVAYTTAPARLDLGGGKVLNVRRMSKNTPCGGWGHLKHVRALESGYA